jgi:hypothetical protein
MNRIILIFILVILLVPGSAAQESEREARESLLRSIGYSNPDLLAPPPEDSPGYPKDITDEELLKGFHNPPEGYGEVPFWWWSGDPLDRDRLLWQIEELHKKGISGMQVNYIHKDSPGWPTYPATPEIFTRKWWDIWKFAREEASKRNMGLGLSGYTIDWPQSQNLFNKIIYSTSEIQGQELLVDTILRVSNGEKVSISLPDNIIMAWRYDSRDGKPVPGGRSLMPFVVNNILNWSCDADQCEIWIYTSRRKPGTLNPIHPLSGSTVINNFFQQFEENSWGAGSSGLNYFFQDELKFGVGDLIWTDDLADEFRKLKGYDMFTMLPGMFKDIGSLTTKARLDFMDVKVRLSEERYFRPIFEWHWKRGMIYGCDPEGRGRNPGEYGDNFRIQRWYTAPGHDTPSGRADLIKGKVSGSIAALYRRPRVWLEGYHSLGWGATPQQIMNATNENYLYGCNLLNLHGLYYTTHGSYWEWAPPCYHFRMPYWDHMTIFLKYFERLSWLMSHGTLLADIAILYPVSTAQAGMGEKEATAIAFESGTTLFNNGYDFLFIDDQSLIRSETDNGFLNVTDQSFKVLILPSMKAIRWTTLQKAIQFFRNGGVVIACGSLPEASDRAGRDDPALNDLLREFFGVSSFEMNSGTKPSVQKHSSGGLGIFTNDSGSLISTLNNLLPKHLLSEKQVRFSHRKIGERDVFMVMGAKRNSWCTFRAGGTAEQWDPWTGNTIPLYSRKTMDGTLVPMPLDSAEAQIIVFTPDNETGKVFPEPSFITGMYGKIHHKIALGGDWEFELKPTMDNRWGDFRLPATEKIIGAEARIFSYSEDTKNTMDAWQAGFNYSGWKNETYGFGQKFWKLGPLPDDVDQAVLDKKLASLKAVDPAKPVIINGKPYLWSPYSFSWRFGVEGDPGHQGYHGLKEEITDEFICLGKPSQGLNETVYKKEEGGSLYYLWTSAFSENVTNVTIHSGGFTPSSVYINGREIDDLHGIISLRKGSNPLLIKYSDAGRGHFVLLKEGYRLPEKRTPLSMKWWDIEERVGFDVRPGEKNPAGWYRFTAPPGLKNMIIRPNGSIQVWIDGKPAAVKASDSVKSALIVEPDEVKFLRSEVAVKVEQTKGNYGGAAFAEPVLVNCTKGLTTTGDWSEGSILENYSGGAFYRKKITLKKEEAASKVILDLGNVVATAEVRINDSEAVIIVTPPWRIDITRYVKPGENKIEVLVYNTLANHYLTIPTRYRGPSLQSGLLGPVILEIQDKN